VRYVVRRLWRSIPISTASLTGLIFAFAATGALAHEGHSHDDGRIPGQPDFKRIGTHEFEFHPKAHAYTHKRSPNGVPLWFHVDDFAASSPFAPGALNDLPPSTEPVVCASSGHRIKVAYAESYLKWKSQDPYMTSEDREAIRNAVLRMNWKIKNESLLSSDGEMALRMRVDCDGLGHINVSELVVFSYPYNQPSNVWAEADKVFGKPEGANSIKHLIFFDGPGPVVDQYGTTASGFGEVFTDSKKSSSDASDGNNNRYYTASAVIYNPGGADPLGYWDSHVTLHELFHTMGAVQPNAPFATSAKHCTDGIDVMCYNDTSQQGLGYTESRCPFPDYDTPVGTPLDCEYNTYFDAVEESQEWLNTNWNVGGAENPFLVQSASPPAVCDYNFSSSIKVGNINSDGKTDIYQFSSQGLHGWHSAGSSYTGLGKIGSGFGSAYQDRIVDIDGDGDDDAFQVLDDGRVYAWLSNGASYTGVGLVGSQISLGGACRIGIVDMNGDGKDDIMRFSGSGAGYVWLSNGSAGTYTYIGQKGNGYGLPVEMRSGDFDGDGDDDLIRFLDNGNAYGWRSSGTGFIALGTIGSGFGNSYQVQIGDRDNDGDEDIFRFTDNGAGFAWESNGSPTATWYTPLGSIGAGFGLSRQMKLADINADGRVDILKFADNGVGYGWKATGSSPVTYQYLDQIGSGFGAP
jgi:FG-GAP-like repeat